MYVQYLFSVMLSLHALLLSRLSHTSTVDPYAFEDEKILVKISDEMKN